MAILNPVWYVRDNSNANSAGGGTVGWSAVAQWQASTAYTVGRIVRQVTSPTYFNERCFVCIVAGTSGSTQPSWTITKGAKTTDSTVVWMECTGMAAVNGDSANTPAWAASNTVTLGTIVYDSSTTSYQIVTTAGTTGSSAPSFSSTAGTTVADNTVTWTSLGNASGFTTWGAPFARLRSAFTSTWGVQGDTIYISNDHQDSASSANNNISSTISSYTSPFYVYSITPASALSPVLSAGATVSTTSIRNIIIDTFAYFYGISFQCGSGAVTASLGIASSTNSSVYFDNCQFALNNTGPTSFLNIGGSTLVTTVNFNQCTLKFAVSNHSIQVGAGKVVFNACSIDPNTVSPTVLVSQASGLIRFVGCDLSVLGNGTTLIGTTGSATSRSDCQFLNCNLGSAVTLASTPASPASIAYITVSDSTNTTYQNQKYAYSGTLIPETTVVRTGGATNGITPTSWKITTTANSPWIFPFESYPIAIWNATTGSNVTITVYGIWDSASLPTNNDIWMEAAYLGSSSTPISTLATTGKATPVAASTSLQSDTSTWGGSTTAFKMSLTVTPQLAGDIYITVKFAKPSTTFYIDPQVVLS